jgi:F-type H+-transporting ATPase subunit b
MKARFILLIAAVVVSGAVSLGAQEHAASTPAAHAPAEQHEAGWGPTLAKAFNFALLVGVLGYFLKTPISEYIAGRVSKVREDLVTAAQTRETASRQLAEIDAKLKELPAELEALKVRGAEEIAAERVRIEAAAEEERRRLLEHTRREIDMRLRIAQRELVEHAADLAVQVAGARIKQTITPDDQARLVDRYAAQIAGAGTPRGGARQ